MSSLFPVEPEDESARLQFLYDRLADRFGFAAAEVRLSDRKLTGGEIVYGQPHRITISSHLSPAEREDTLRHEAAHAWAYHLEGERAGHGPLFRRLSRHIGASPRKAPLTTALAEHRRRNEILYRCEGCRRVFRRYRLIRGARYCVRCDREGRPSRLRRLKREDSES
ncbi:MAG TPA: SprT-like domain-containing protein [Thermoanaerobaculia bacterium]|nr:SprT-like domain-containing protein [Thermoanaerobaculia bacterium]